MSDLTWTCHYCNFPIADGRGALAVPYEQISRGTSPTWRPLHHACMPHDGFYCIDVERIRTEHQLLWWTAHLMGKTWLHKSNWCGVLWGVVQPERKEVAL